MTATLLAKTLSTGAVIGIIVACVLGASLLVWGLFRRFSRVSWTGWQVLILFFASFLLSYLKGSGALLYSVALAGFFVLAALLLGLGALIRRAMRNHGKYGLGVRVVSSLLGGFTALVNLAVCVLALGGIFFAYVQAAGVDLGLGAVLTHPVWTKFFAGHAADLFLIGFLVLAIKGGYRLGFTRSLLGIVAVVLTIGSFVGALLFTTRVGFMRDFAGAIAGAFPQTTNTVISTVVGYCVVVLIAFIVFFAVSMCLTALINLLIKKMDRSTGFRVVDGCILAAIFFIFAAALTMGVHYGVQTLAGGVLLEYGEMGDAVTGVAKALEQTFCSAPMSRIFYLFHPINLILG